MFPANTLVTDMVIQTPWRERRVRFFWDLTVAPTGITQIEACCNRLMVTHASVWAGFMTTQVFVTRFEGRWYGPSGTTFEGNSTSAQVQGSFTAVTPNSASDATGSSASADTLPDEVCFIIQKRTGVIGRSSRGRWFICGLGEAVQNAGEVDTEYRALLKGVTDQMSTDVAVTVGFSTVMHARHYNRKSNILQPIVKCYALRTMGSRRDRRSPLRLSRL